MIDELEVKIENVKNIKSASLAIPLKPDIYGIIGSNGIGKSSIMACLAQVIYSHSLDIFQDADVSENTHVILKDGKMTTKWIRNKFKWTTQNMPYKNRIHYLGLYEGSLFYGTRFKDSKIVDEMVRKNKFSTEDIIDADDYIKDKLSFILHGNYDFYKNLKRIRNKNIAEKYSLKNVPYFIEINGTLVSQYRMSSGECLLVSLLHFIYNSIERRSLPQDQPILMLIDEIELALHPVAVIRLFNLLKELVNDHNNLVVILSSHSPEVIRMISPYNLFCLERSTEIDGKIDVVNPCYPSYAIRDVYMHDGFDYVILVEDYLAKTIVQTIIRNKNLACSKLIHVLPVGGWNNVLTLQKEIYDNSLFGSRTKVFSILDGDVEEKVNKSNKRTFQKLFIPIGCVEKFLLNILINNPVRKLKKLINDQFFNVKTIDAIIEEYIQDKRSKNYNDTSGKKFYSNIVHDLENRGLTEREFVESICRFAQDYIDFSSFEKNLIKMLSET